MPDTAVGVLTDIIEGLGSTTDAQTVVPALKDLQSTLSIEGVRAAVGDYIDADPSIITDEVDGFLTTQGAAVALAVTDGDLSISITAGEGE